MITVFTSTYNRAYLLPRLYESLKNQTFKDIEWLIVDDGSTDGTHDLVDGWINEELLDIRYYYQENGGKHRAINRGALLAKGEWFFIVDSDDYLPDNSLEIANKWIATIKDDDTFAGVCGIKKDINSNLHSKFPFEMLDVSPLRINEYAKGDKAEIFKTAILGKYPFPDIPGENFCAEGLVCSRIGLKYKIRYFNETIYFCEYLKGGLTKLSIRNRRLSSSYTLMLYREQIRYQPTLRGKVQASINYWRFVWFNKHNSRFTDIPFFFFFFMPLGFLKMLLDNKLIVKDTV